MDGEGSGETGESDNDGDDVSRLHAQPSGGRGRSWGMGRGIGRGRPANGRGVAHRGAGRGWRPLEEGSKEGRAVGLWRAGWRIEGEDDEEPALVRRLDLATESNLPVLTAELEGGDGFGG
jgi:hypothetical protein